MAFLSVLAIVASGWFAARLLSGRKARWVGIVVAVAGYFSVMNSVSSALNSGDAAPTLASVLVRWAAAVVAGMVVSAALTAGLRKVHPVSASPTHTQ